MDSTARAPRVLAVDDEESIRRIAERVLRGVGYDVVVASDGPEALRIAQTQGPFEVFVTDLVMPGMRGDELGRRLRGADPDVQVLYLTGYSDSLFAEKAALGEHEAFLEKPVSRHGLLEAVSLMLFGHTRGPPNLTPRQPNPCRQAFDELGAALTRARGGWCIVDSVIQN